MEGLPFSLTSHIIYINLQLHNLWVSCYNFNLEYLMIEEWYANDYTPYESQSTALYMIIMLCKKIKLVFASFLVRYGKI